MIALCLFTKILLGVCLRKRPEQAQNMITLEKLLCKMCCCDTDYNIIGHVASNKRNLFCSIFGELDLTEKIIVSMEKLMLPRKILNIIEFFCKAQHNA